MATSRDFQWPPTGRFPWPPSDWLVSEVGRDSEGRGGDLSRALAALSAGAALVVWGRLLTEALAAGEESQ
jgi:hypothetical protein